MGTLLGHALPGSFFLFYALWRIIQITRRLQLLRHFRSHGGHLEYYTSATYPCYVGRCSRYPVEGAAKVIMTTVGLVGEMIASTDYGRAGKITSLGDIQHVSMYALFLVSGVVDLLSWCAGSAGRPAGLVACRRLHARFGVAMPVGVDFLALCVAFSGELILFSQHTHGRTPFDKHVHFLLLFVLAATVLSLVAEMRYRSSLLASLSTCFLLLVQGSWFIQVGLLLYPPLFSVHHRIQQIIYSQPVDEQIQTATLIFTWHLGTDFIVLLLAFLLLQSVYAVFCRCAALLSLDNLELELGALIDDRVASDESD